MASHLQKFNTSLSGFVSDVKNMNIDNKDVAKLEDYVSVVHINARAIISNFQAYVLKDEIVRHILSNDVNYFLEHKFEEQTETQQQVITKTQDIVRQTLQSGNHANIEKTCKWLQILCYYAYSDIGIDASKKFKELFTQQEIQEYSEYNETKLQSTANSM